MEGTEQARSRAAINWPRFLRAALLLSVTCAFVALTIGGAFLIDDPAAFFADNAMSQSGRIWLVVVVLVGGIVGVTISGLAVLFRKDRGAQAIDLASKRWSPLGLVWALAALATNHLWQDHKLTFLVLLGGTVLLLERSLWVSGMTFPSHFLDGLGERYDRLPARFRRFAPLSFVLLSAIGYASYTGYWSIEQHHRLATASFDLGIIDNLMFNVMSGHGFRAPVLFGPSGGSLLAGHATFVLYLFLPFYWLSPRAETLLIIQSVLLGFAAVPLYGFAKTLLPRWSAAFVAVAYLLYAPLHGLNFYDFHYLPSCIFFLFCLFWALSANRTVLVWVLWAICVSIREDVPVGLTMLGVFLVFSGYRVRTGIWMTVLSLISFVVIKFVIMQMAGTWWFASLYDDLMPEGQRNYGGVVMTLLTNPAYVVSTLVTEEKLIYLLHLLVPLVFLPLRRWIYLWLLFAGFFFTVLTTNYKPTVSISFQYVSHWVPYLFAAAVLALSAMGRSRSGIVHRRAALAAVVVGVVLHSMSFGAILRPTRFVGGFQRIPFQVTEAERARYRDLREVVAMIPPEASVAATDPENPHISNRVTAYPFRTGSGEAEYLLIRKLTRANARKNAQQTIDEHPYGLLAQVGEFYLFKRGHESTETADALKKLRLKPGQRNE
ncbi:MAG: DUF2079 domain-containing protein [Myxococcales bacterium]|nr:DUF2079 domain-containing protein [Myxococcales bacterium]MDH3485017.1 DUF2079 domain-containing protein [Myxococcales bacterium]